jgi:hypothetical protein
MNNEKNVHQFIEINVTVNWYLSSIGLNLFFAYISAVNFV